MDNIFVNYFISTFVEARSRNTWSVRPCYTYASLLSQTKDHRSRHPQTLNICCILIDGDIIQMNFSTFIFPKKPRVSKRSNAKKKKKKIRTVYFPPSSGASRTKRRNSSTCKRRLQRPAIGIYADELLRSALSSTIFLNSRTATKPRAKRVRKR